MNAFVVTPVSMGAPDPDQINKMLGLETHPALLPPMEEPKQLTLPSFEPLDPNPENHQHDLHLPPHEAAHDEKEDDWELNPGSYFALFSEKEFARHMGFTLQTIASWRKAGKGPAYTMIGKQIFYQEKEILKWLDAHTRVSGT